MIKPIILEKGENTPEVILDQDNNVFQISGRSIVENAHEFYAPILEWFKNYLKEPNKNTELTFYLDYINSSSSLQIMKLILLFEHNRTKNNEIKVVWFYDDQDEMSKERGEELKHATGINFELHESISDDFEDFDFEF